MTTEPIWKALCYAKRKAQQDSIPSEWIIPSYPISAYPDIIDVPEICGLLTSRELLISETTDVDEILAKLRSAEWTAVETTLAFYKRAVIAHQLVSEVFYVKPLHYHS